MRCIACDDMLTSGEMGKKSPITGEEYLLCRPCLKEAGLLSPQEQQEFLFETATVPLALPGEAAVDDFALIEEDE